MTPPKRLDPALITDTFLARASGSHLLRMLATLSKVFENDILLGVVFVAISQAATAHLGLGRELRDYDGDGIVPDDLRRPVSVLSIANSLNMPRETVRRYVTRLLKLGYCIQVQGRRVIVPAEVYRRPEILDAAQANRRDLQVLLAAIRRTELPKEDPPGEF